MDAIVVRTAAGLIAYGDSDYEVIERIPIGKPVKITIGTPRNLLHHRKYFRTAWEYLPDYVQEFYHHSVEVFRKTLEVSVGHCDKVYNLNTEEWLDVPKSISFESLNQEEFSELYDKVMNLIVEMFISQLPDDDQYEFYKILLDT